MHTLIASLGPVMIAVVPTLSSVLVYALTAGIKRMESVASSDTRRATIRVIAAFLSFGANVGGALAAGTMVDQSVSQDFVQVLMSTLITYFGATAIHDHVNG